MADVSDSSPLISHASWSIESLHCGFLHDRSFCKRVSGSHIFHHSVLLIFKSNTIILSYSLILMSENNVNNNICERNLYTCIFINDVYIVCIFYGPITRSFSPPLMSELISCQSLHGYLERQHLFQLGIFPYPKLEPETIVKKREILNQLRQRCWYILCLLNRKKNA